MARLDVTDILLDPDFIDALVCERIVQSVGDDGIAVNTATEAPVFGCVTNADGDRLQRTPAGERVASTILVHTKSRLRAGNDGYTADILRFEENRYTVMQVSGYSHFGRGFVAATCELIPLSGGPAPADDLS